MTVASYKAIEEKGPVLKSAGIFNATIAGVAIAAAFDLGLIEELEATGELNVPAFCGVHDLNAGCVTQIVRALTLFEVTAMDAENQIVFPGRMFQQVSDDKSYFLWLIGGYGYALQNLATLSRNSSWGSRMDDRSLVKRDGGIISTAARHYGARFVDRDFFAVLEPCEGEVIADLGCGSAARLVQIATRNPDTRGIGIDIDQNAISVARETVGSSGLDHRIHLLRADITKLNADEGFARVTTLTSFFMGHDLWPKRNCLAVLENLRFCFPAVRRFLLCDTYRAEPAFSCDVPIFTLGFELLHSVMRQEIPTRLQWMELFAESSWKCVHTRYIGIPNSAIFELIPA
jgi:phenylpyruvate C(3)-methyltransferase